MPDQLLVQLLTQGGLAGVAGVAVFLLNRAYQRHDEERKATIAALLEVVKGNTEAMTRLAERIEGLGMRGAGGRRGVA